MFFLVTEFTIFYNFFFTILHGPTVDLLPESTAEKMEKVEAYLKIQMSLYKKVLLRENKRLYIYIK